ncbi:geranylgeranyl pyrophosphate synthase [Leptospira yasudae]|uniref:Geranylgeranyl pyrophosphate synthase n=1 Tax=Leptospira yasudae TaxID=2202201 RepID=A0ABX9LZM3_9LEPT|nr:polyprenyl synthetase family protein [Leptospira yasudae]MBW0435258.1 polyprenyl synthetase family protein [Leptospira yasudae]RHX78069.1 geranylgeranyl pyrophosphate synthase [Leptospira yasudae]RHX91047.1 geranylgeranyl pyrophosphate synthase [Leptospira yasudae]TGK26254.1 polyprenyl synthetase family protein [Leptospira yasudae]TGM08501.1 polyprenyl synthetase family protein [Leptospira yasudae]
MKASVFKDSLVRKFDKKLEAIIREDLKILAEIKSYTIKSGGKRIRPILHYCLCQLLGYPGKHWLDVGAIAELIHAASLLHDDVVDEAETRRGLQSVGSKFGNKTAILAGDYLLACGIDHLNGLGYPELMDIFTQVIKDLSVSELIQMEWEKNPKITLEIYNRVVYGKTASLFGAVSASAGVLSEKNEKEKKKLRQFGIDLGSFFQKKDDAIDYFTPASKSGKVPLKDFYNGLYTYPILLLLEKADKNDKKLIHSLFAKEERSQGDGVVILSLLSRYQIREQMDAEFQAIADNLMKFLNSFEESSIRNLLKEQILKLLEE